MNNLEVSSSLIHFWKTSFVQNRLSIMNKTPRILEIGQESESFILQLDKESQCRFVPCFEFCQNDFKNEFDFIVDSHSYHTLLSDEERSLTLKKIQEALVLGGFYILETMVLHKSISFDFDLFFDFDNQVLWCGENPCYRVRHPHEVEEEVVQSGLKIDYFRVYDNIKLIPWVEERKALKSDPHVLRVIISKI